MLPDAALQLVRDLNSALGDCLLVDGKRGRALLSNHGRLLDVCKGLRRGGFTRAIDFTAMDLALVGADLVSARLDNAEDGPRQARPLQNDFAFYLRLRAPKFGHCALLLKWKWTLASEPHPSLGLVWPSCGLAEREMLEMLGIPFAGNLDLRPLLLDMRFHGYPLRSDFKAPPPQDYAAAILHDRHEAGLIFGLRQASDNASAGTAVATTHSPESRVLRPSSASVEDENGLRTQDAGLPATGSNGSPGYVRPTGTAEEGSP